MGEADRLKPTLVQYRAPGFGVGELWVECGRIVWSELPRPGAVTAKPGADTLARRLEAQRRRNLASEVFAVASSRAKAHLERAVADDPELRRLLDEVQSRQLDPLSAVREIMRKVFKVEGGDGTDAR